MNPTFTSDDPAGSDHSRELTIHGSAIGFPDLARVIVTTDFLSDRVRWHDHPFWEILMVFRGGASYEFSEGCVREIYGDHFLVVPPGVRHRGVEEVRLPSELMSIGVAGPCTGKGHSPLNPRESRDLRSSLLSASLEVVRLSPSILREANYLRLEILKSGHIPEMDGVRRARIRHRTALLLVGLTENIVSRETRPLSNAVAAAIEFLKSKLVRTVGMDVVADKVGLPRKQFYLRFRQETGMTPNDFLQRLRLHAAEKLLVNTDLTVETVGAEAGFPRASYFCRVFRNYFGRTPGQYRIELRKSQTGPP